MKIKSLWLTCIISFLFVSQYAFAETQIEEPKNEVLKVIRLDNPEKVQSALRQIAPHLQRIDPNRDVISEYAEKEKEIREALFNRLEKLKKQSATKEKRLVQPSLNVLRSDKFLIKFRSKTLLNSFSRQTAVNVATWSSAQKAEAVRKKVNGISFLNTTLIKDGVNALCVKDYYEKDKNEIGKIYKSEAYLYYNGKSYVWNTQNDKTAIDAENIKYINRINAEDYKDRLLAKRVFEKDYNYLMNNVDTDSEHKYMIFSKTGEQNIGGDIFQYEEYETLRGTEIIRYYLKDGQLKKYVCLVLPDLAKESLKHPNEALYKNSNVLIDTGSFWKEICEKETSEISDGRVSRGLLLDVSELRSDVDFTQLLLPQGIISN